jgi:glutathione peroxidase
MKHLFIAILSVFFLSIGTCSYAQDSLYDFTLTALSGEPAKLSNYKDQVILIVNTASKCGLTPQYEGLESLYKKYKDAGFVILGFPCNQFGKQEPGSAEEIASFCSENYGVTFPMFEKTEVNGDNTHPLFAYLKNYLPLEGDNNNIRWNFEKFLIDRNGVPIKRYEPQTKPSDLEQDVVALIR